MRKEKCDKNQIKCHNLGSSQKLKNGDGKQNAVLRTFFLPLYYIYTDGSPNIGIHDALLQ